MERQSSYDYDRILQEEVSDCGLWQTRLFLLLCIPSAMSSMAVFMYEIIAFTPDHRCFVAGCDDPINLSYEADHLNFTIPEKDYKNHCWVYSNVNDSCDVRKDSLLSQTSIHQCSMKVFSKDLLESTATEDLDMVCDNSWKKSSAQTMYMAGMLIGSFVFGWSGDKFGRKPTLILSVLLLAFGGCLPALLTMTPDLYMVFVVSRMISGLGHVGTFMVTVNLSLEYVSSSYRAIFGILIEIPFALGGVIVGLVSWAGVRSWQPLMIIISLPNLLLISYWWILPESPRWMLSKGHLDQFQDFVINSLNTNKKKLPLQTDSLKDPLINYKTPIKLSSNGELEQEQITLLDLFYPLSMFLRTSCLSINWLITVLCYFGLTSVTSVLTPNFYLNFILVGLAEIPACILCVVLMDRCGRRLVGAGCQIFAGVSCITAGLLHQYSFTFLQVPLSLLGKVGSSGALGLLFVYTAELYPTSVRSTSLGLCSTWGRVGGMLAPQVYLLASWWLPLPMIIMGISSLFGGILILMLLPETEGHKLPDTMEEAIRIGQQRSKVPSDGS